MFCFSYKQILICCCWVWSLESCCCQCMVFLWTWLPHTSEFCWSTSILSSLQVSVDERKQVSLSASCNFLAPSYIITFIKCHCIYHFLRYPSLKNLPKYKTFKLFETVTFLNEQSEWNSISICSSLILCLLSYGWKFGKSLCIITGFLHTCFGKKTLKNSIVFILFIHFHFRDDLNKQLDCDINLPTLHDNWEGSYSERGSEDTKQYMILGLRFASLRLLA